MLLPTQCPLELIIILGQIPGFPGCSSSFTIACKLSEKNPPVVKYTQKKEEQLSLIVHTGACIPSRLRQEDLEFQVSLDYRAKT